MTHSLRIGQNLQNLLLLDYYYINRRKFWKCKCICGNLINRRDDHIKKNMNTCCGCLYTAVNGDKNGHWKGHGELSGSYFAQILRRAKRHGDNDLTIQFLWELFEKQERKCKLSGQPITLKAIARRVKRTASLDRIDSLKPYIRENVQWVHKDVNLIKNNLDQGIFIEICKIIHDPNYLNLNLELKLENSSWLK